MVEKLEALGGGMCVLLCLEFQPSTAVTLQTGVGGVLLIQSN